MSRYAITHSPAVQAYRQQRPNEPLLNSYQLQWWKDKAREMGLSDHGSKQEIYIRVIAKIRERENYDD